MATKGPYILVYKNVVFEIFFSGLTKVLKLAFFHTSYHFDAVIPRLASSSSTASSILGRCSLSSGNIPRLLFLLETLEEDDEKDNGK